MDGLQKLETRVEELIENYRDLKNQNEHLMQQLDNTEKERDRLKKQKKEAAHRLKSLISKLSG
jgi:uncharacterized protein (TIGR02449 family)